MLLVFVQLDKLRFSTLVNAEQLLNALSAPVAAAKFALGTLKSDAQLPYRFSTEVDKCVSASAGVRSDRQLEKNRAAPNVLGSVKFGVAINALQSENTYVAEVAALMSIAGTAKRLEQFQKWLFHEVTLFVPNNEKYRNLRNC